MTVKEIVDKIRKEQGLTITQIGAVTRRTEQTVRMWVREDRLPESIRLLWEEWGWIKKEE